MLLWSIIEFSAYFGMQDELIALNETAIKYGGKLIWSPGQETLGVLNCKLEISHEQVFINVQEEEYV